MALTTSTTVSSNTLAFLLAQSLDPQNDKLAALSTLNMDSIAGQPTKKLQIPVLSDFGDATAATEGTDITTSTTFAYDSPVEVTPTEVAAVRMLLTRTAIQRMFPAFDANPVEVARSGSIEQVLAMLQRPYNKAIKMIMGRLEALACATLSSVTNAVGDAADPLTVEVMLESIFTFKKQKPVHDDAAFLLDPSGVYDLQTQLLGSAALTGTAWVQQADASFVRKNPDLQRRGYEGSFLGFEMLSMTEGKSATSGVNGAVQGLVCRGDGVTGQGQTGWATMVEGQTLQVDTEADGSNRSVELIVIQEAGFAALLPARQAVKILSVRS